MKGIHKVLITWFILFYIRALEFVPIPLIIYASEALLLMVCFIYTFKFIRIYGIHGITIPILIYAFIYPIYGAISANMVFGQPFYMGFLSLRYELFILFVFYLISVGAKYGEVLKIINKVNICVAILSIIAFFVFGLNSVTIMSWVNSTRTVEVDFSDSGFALKGEFLMICYALLNVSFIYYLDKLFHKHDKSDVVIFCILIFYLLFVHKGRGPILILGFMYLFEVFQIKSVKNKIILLLIPLFLGSVYVSFKPESLASFTEILKFQDTEDGSTAARMVSITEAFNYIQEYPLWGIGNLSAHFGDDGFHTFFPKTFYVADIGIIGSLMMGGMVLLLIYVFIFVFLTKNYNLYHGSQKSVLKCYIVFFVAIMFVMGDPLTQSTCFSFALLYFPLVDPKIKARWKKEISK